MSAAQAFARAGGEYAPILQTGINFHTGDTGKSLTGATGYVVTFRAEKRKGIFRPSMAADLNYASGNASIGSDTPTCTLMGLGFLGGVHIFPFTTGRFQPFFGGSGVFSWAFMKLPSPPTGVEPNTQGLAFGYEISAGVDLRLGNVEGNAVRIHGGLWNVTSSLGGVSGFQLTGFRFLLGIAY